TQTMTRSLAAATAAGDAAARAPAAFSSSIGSYRTSWTVSVYPAWTMLCASGLPWNPRPINPIRIEILPFATPASLAKMAHGQDCDSWGDLIVLQVATQGSCRDQIVNGGPDEGES